MGQNGERALQYAIRLTVLGRYLGQLALMLALLVVPPLGASLAFDETAVGLRYLAVVAALVAVGWPLSRIDAPDRIQGNEAMAIVTLAFVMSPLLMIWPIMAAGLAPVDALFEAVSAVTTTGLSTLSTLEGLPRTFLFARAWMQWYGGLGIAVLAVAILAQHGRAARKLVEHSGAELDVSSTRAHAHRVLAVYLGLTAIGFALIWAAGLAPFDALIHVLAAVSTGGFSSFDASLGGDLPPFVPWAVLGVALLGAISLPLYYFVWRRGPGVLLGDLELRGLIAFVAAVTLTLALWFWSAGASPAEALSAAGLLTISAQSSAGFSAQPIASLHAFPLGVLLIAMAVGGSVGSTAGGVKLLRVLVLLRLVQAAVRRAAAPVHAVIEPRLGGRRLEQDDIVSALFIVALFVGVVLLSWLAFLAHGYPPLPALFEVVSAAGTVGLSAGVTAPDLPTALKLVLCLDMIAGRVEIVALLATLYPGSWIGRKREA